MNALIMKISVIWRKLELYKMGGTKDFLMYLLNLETSFMNFKGGYVDTNRKFLL